MVGFALDLAIAKNTRPLALPGPITCDEAQGNLLLCRPGLNNLRGLTFSGKYEFVGGAPCLHNWCQDLLYELFIPDIATRT